MRIDKNTTIRLGNRNIVKIKIGDSVIWQKTTEPVVEPEYFYIESLGDGNTVKLITKLINTSHSSYITPTIEYSTDKQNWTTITFDWSTTGIKNINIPVELNTGDKMYFRNDTGKFSRTIYGGGSYNTSYITFTTNWQGIVNVGGDIRTLINYRNVDNTILEDGMFSNLFSHTYGGTTTAGIVDASNLKLPFTEMTLYCYYSMFQGCFYLTSTPELPATTLAESCYSSMFQGCTSLTTLPELPATILSERCYSNMFRGCTSLTTAPTPPATTLAEYCYNAMFYGCTSLTSAPELPITTLATSCYSSMFRGCTSLTTAPELPATTMQYGCYSSMFQDCTSLTTAPELPATTMKYGCYSSMFQDCTSLTTAPELPATTLDTECYKYMFYGCSSLTSAPALPATTLAGSCYQYMFQGCTSLNKILVYANSINSSGVEDWLSNVAATGTFYNAGSATYPTDSPSGIPTGWTEVKTVPTTTSVYAVPDTFSAKSWMDKYKLNYIIMGVNETGIDVPLGEQNELITIGKNTGSSTVTHTETFNYDGMDYTITINQTANDTDEPDYFYIESLGDGNTVSVINKGYGNTDNVTPTLEYSTDKNTWDTITFDWTNGTHTTELPIALNTGEKMYFRNDTRLFSNSSSKYISFSSSVSSNVGGDIRTLSNYLDVNNETKPQSYMFYYLFYNNKYIIDASNLRLLYTTLASECYYNMFYGCSSLTTAPTLPATTLAGGCYRSMFENCTSLVNAPELPATTMQYGCYQYMFRGCTSLTTAPELPATTLAESCYNSMFRNCGSLTTAPELPATTLEEWCYSSMFNGCNSLTSVTIYATSTANNSFDSWLDNVAPSGTVYNNGLVDLPENSASGVPSGWTENIPPIESITANPDTFTIEFNNETVTCNSTLEVVTTMGTLTNTNSVTLTVGENTGNTTRTITETIPYKGSSYDVTIVQSAIQSITANPDTFTIKSYKDTVKCTSTLTITTTLGTTVTDTNTATITVGENTGDTTRTLTETIPYKGSSYQVTIVQTANDVKPVTSWNVVSTGTYPFELNTNGYYESTNKRHDSSYSYATLNYSGFDELVLECINSGESNYDYGIISQPDVLLSESIEDDGATGSTKVFKNFKVESSTNPVQITIPSDVGSHFITIKFRKDSSTSSGNDSLQFKVIEP